MGQGRQKPTGGEAGSSSTNLPFLFLAILLAAGTAMLLTAALSIARDTTLYVLLEQFGSTLIGAAVIGFTYEWLLHKKREALLKAFAADQLKATNDALDAFVATTPREIFSLLEDIATKVDKIPTLYTPARIEGSEYTFASSVDYFTDLIAARRQEVVGVLRNWIKETSDHKLKFLASDFVGLFKLHELRDELRAQIDWTGWETMPAETKAWLLNYCWAAARADQRQMYADLAQIMRNTPYEDVQRWVLFVPRQMKDPELVSVIRAYLERDDLTREQRAWTIPALAELWEADERGVRNIFRRHRAQFNDTLLVTEIRKVWREHNISPDPILRTISAQPHRIDPPAPVAEGIAD